MHRTFNDSIAVTITMTEQMHFYYPQEEIFPNLMDQNCKKMELSNWFAGLSLLEKTLYPVSQTLVALEMNLTSSSLFLSDQLEYVVQLPPLFRFTSASGCSEAVGF